MNMSRKGSVVFSCFCGKLNSGLTALDEVLWFGFSVGLDNKGVVDGQNQWVGLMMVDRRALRKFSMKNLLG